MNKEQWICVCCQTSYGDEKDKPLQVDYVDGKHALLSNYYDQYLINLNGNIKLNDCYCVTCINPLIISQNIFEAEPKYTFEQNGYTCWNIEKRDAYKRECFCEGCQKSIVTRSLFIPQSTYFIILWTANLCSLAFHDFDRSKVYTLDNPSKFYQNKVQFLCEDCFKQESWIQYQGPIRCQFCNETFCRAVNRYDYKPVNFALSCNVYTSGEYIYDGYIDPKMYKWINKPVDYDEDKLFCLSCLDELIKNNVITEISYETASDGSEEEMVKNLREKHPDLFKLSFEKEDK